MDISWAESLGRAAIFLGIPFVILVFVAQWHWAKTCDHNIQVLIAQRGGGGAYRLAPKEGGVVSIENPETKEIRTWPINELATIDVPYPGLGFLPRWMQKSIRLAIVNEGDWEPMLNRSPHRKKIASPDVVVFLRELAEDNPNLAELINEFLDGISTGPTREMVADPSTFGSLMRSTVMRALATIGDDVMEMMKGLRAQLARAAGLNPTWVYLLLGLNIVLIAFVIYQLMQMGSTDVGTLIEKVDAIQKALGVK